MSDQPQPHELSTITFSINGETHTWSDAVLISTDGPTLMFLDKEERLHVVSGGAYHVMQQGKLPEKSPVVTPNNKLSIVGAR